MLIFLLSKSDQTAFERRKDYTYICVLLGRTLNRLSSETYDRNNHWWWVRHLCLMIRMNGSFILTREQLSDPTWMVGFIQSFRNQRRHVGEVLPHLDDHLDWFASIARGYRSDQDHSSTGYLDLASDEQCETFYRSCREYVRTADSQRSFRREEHLKRERRREKIRRIDQT